MTDVASLPSDDGSTPRRGQLAVPARALRYGLPARPLAAPVRAPSSMMDGARQEREDPQPQPRRIQFIVLIGVLVVSMLLGALLEPTWRGGRSSLPQEIIKLVQAVPGVGPWFSASLSAGVAQAASLDSLPPAPVKPEELLPASLLDLTPEEAREMNAKAPISKIKSAVAEPFLMPHTDLVARQRAAQCLTAAVYYEAAQEPPAGQRGVAQVVINRMRHPAYPKSVCGVVFQGSERATGCQFTFSCDGALRRQPDPVLWARAQQVAEAALNGWVERSVGLSTHYHANYVVPRWASSLVKTSVQGAHIFYRWTGGWGTPAAFNGKWSGIEEQVAGLPAIEADDEPVLVLASAEIAPAPAPSVEASASTSASTGVAETAVAIAPVVSAPVAPQPRVEGPAPIAKPEPAPSSRAAPRPRRLPVPSNW